MKIQLTREIDLYGEYEAGVEILCYTRFVDAIVEQGTPPGVAGV